MSNILVEKLRNGWHIFTHEDRIEAADAIERLQAENADLAAKCNHIMTEHGKLLEEVEGLRKDAARMTGLEALVRASGYAVQLRQVRDPAKDAGMNRYIVTTGVGSGPWQRDYEALSFSYAIDAAMPPNP